MHQVALLRTNLFGSLIAKLKRHPILNQAARISDDVSTKELVKNYPKVVFSGIQPTGSIHLGNYLGAIRKWVDFQNNDDDCIFSIVDLHSITMPHQHLNIKENLKVMAATIIACGIDTDRSILYQQSRVSEHTSLSWILGCLTTMPRLKSLPQFKEKSAKFTNISVPTGLFIYPILQAADILLYKTTDVPVGRDQLQNVNLCSHLASLFNNNYGKTFPIPRTIIYEDDQLAKIKSLKFPQNKMSKSDPKGVIEILDDPDNIAKKIKKALTDFTSEVYYNPTERPGVSNLMIIHSALSGKSLKAIERENSDIDTGKYKKIVTDVVIEYLKPIRLKANDILKDPGYIESILDKGYLKAKERASKTIDEVYDKIGFKIG